MPKINMMAMSGAATMTDGQSCARAATFSGENRDVFESTERAKAKLAENIEAEERENRHRRSQGMIFHLAPRDVNKRSASRTAKMVSMMMPPTL